MKRQGPTALYMKNIYDAVRTTAIGLRITLKYLLFEPPITVQYPDRLGEGVTVDDLVSDRYRGFLGVEPSKCIACMQCMRTCPIDCIAVQAEKIQDVRHLVRFDVDQSRCMYCNLCVEVCPTMAVFMTKKFEGATFDIKDLCFRHITEPVPVAKREKKEATDAEAPE